MEWWLAYLAIGLIAGFLAGLLGIGGGAVMVPMLVFVFSAQQLPAGHLLHVALGTSMATIVFTSLSSMRAHHGHGAVDWRIARALAPGMLAGAFGAALLAGAIPTRPLAMMFTALVFFVGTQLLLDLKPKETRELPGPAGVFAAGAVIGGISSLAAAGGAFLAIPFLAWCRVPLRQAIGTASATGFPIALAGSAGYIAQGWHAPGLPPGCLGYVYLPALGLVVVMSMLAAPFGARLAHRLPVRRLRMIFALMFYALALRTLTTLW
ncbi:MAG TPA: sulfite exporter TauE/SafE family protein [Burkholderiales bacterium]